MRSRCSPSTLQIITKVAILKVLARVAPDTCFCRHAASITHRQTNMKDRHMANKVSLQTFENSTVTFNEDGWVNATQIAEKYGKKPNEWLRLPDTINYIKALESTYGKTLYAKTSRARKDRGGGTWIHPLLLPEFFVWVGGTRAKRLISNAITDYSALLNALNEFEMPDDLPDMFVYAIQEESTKNIKIGISRDPAKRLQQLQTGNSSKLRLVAVAQAASRFKDERRIHIANENYKIHGEWFTEDAVVDLL